MTVRAPDPSTIAEAARRLRAGEVIGMPTETVYGLGADAEHADGVAAVYRIKGRPADHPLIVHVLDLAQARWWATFDEPALRLAEAFWPGPLTLILRRRADAPDHACGGTDTIGLRCPSHPVARALLAAFSALGGHGIAAPSANRFGRVSPTLASHVADDLGDAVGLILDGGPAEVGVESTIIDLSRGAPVLLRPGGIGATRLAGVLGAALRPRDTGAPRAPGTLAAHYAPRTALELLPATLIAGRTEQLLSAGSRVAVWSAIRPNDPRLTRWEPLPEQPGAFEQCLYDTLRRLDVCGATRLLVEQPPPGADWDAVRDRLQRAAASFDADAR